MLVFVDWEALQCIKLILGILVLLLHATVFAIFIISLVWKWLYFYKKSDPSVLGDDVPGVSIIKPFKGCDSLLQANLESYFTLHYPKFELLLCFHNDHDPAIVLAERLQQKYPNVDARFFFNSKSDVLNPMVQNMVQGYNAAQYEYIWISSSRVKVSIDFLVDMVVKLQQPNVALVHQMPFYQLNSNSLASMVEKVYFGYALSRFYVAFNALDLCCVTGMSYIFRKSLLDQVNGLEWYGKFLAEDFFLTRALHDKGYRLVLSSFPAQQNVSSTTVCAFVDRMVRWHRLRMNMMMVVSCFIEPLTECLTLGIMTAIALHQFFHLSPILYFILHLIVWIGVDYLQVLTSQNGCLSIGIGQFVYVWIVRELLAIWIFAKAIYNLHCITWGSQTYCVHFGGSTQLELKSPDFMTL